MLQAKRSRVRLLIKSLDFSVYLILQAALWSWGRLSLLTDMSTRNLPGGKGGWRIRLTTSLPSVSRLSSKCVSFDVSQLCGSPQSVTGFSFLGWAIRFPSFS
jgi:hypothetical protein